MNKIIKTHPLLRVVNGLFFDLPCPSRISIFWKLGSLAGIALRVQLITGVFLSIQYRSDVSLAFERVRYISRDVRIGWLLRIVHANGARFFFIFLYLHIGRGIYYGSFKFHITWSVGVIIFLLTIAEAFLGYVLPWGQISFWGATVITNFFSAIPYVGNDLVIWIWGGFSVGHATLVRFFTLHFFVPFVILALVIVHLVFLHETGSRNPLGVNANREKIRFGPYFLTKDFSIWLIYIFFLILISFFCPWTLGDPENFLPANSLVTPVHIQPEWYFLFAYGILRSIPNKLGGVIALVLSVLILLIIPFYREYKFKSLSIYPLRKVIYWRFIGVFILLTWIGSVPVEYPYIFTGQVLSLVFFLYFLAYPYFNKFWDWLLR